jgi:RhtB (resistance to homoserine/threonine) family protein
MEGYTVFVLMSLALIITPGADVALVTKNTLSHGKKGGMAAVFGITAGVLVHMLAAALGISAIIAQSALLFEIVRYIGACYLVFLGVQSLISLRKGRHQADTTGNKNETQNAPSGFRQGLLSNVLNPKVAVFFLTFLPQFVNPAENTFSQIFLMGITYAVLGLLWLTLYIWLIDAMRTMFHKPATQKTFQGITGTLLIAMGLKLAMEDR